MTPRLRHYYHIYADGSWQEPLAEHLAALREGGLFERLDRFALGIVGSPENRRAVLDAVQGLRCEEAVYAAEGWEQVTLGAVYRDAVEAARSAEQSYYILYAHSKGAWSRSEIADLWRRVMTKFCVRRWQKAVDALNAGAAAAGCFWEPVKAHRAVSMPQGHNQFFGGNFWWARSDAIAEIGPCDDEHRYAAEAWIGRCRMVLGREVAQLHTSGLSVRAFKAALC